MNSNSTQNGGHTHRFASGDIVDITIKGARVQVCEDENNNLEYEYSSELGTVEGVVALDSAAVTVDDTVPANWPPRPDDLWKHHLGAPLFAMQSGADVVLTNSSGRLYGPEESWAMRHELTLVRREDAK